MFVFVLPYPKSHKSFNRGDAHERYSSNRSTICPAFLLNHSSGIVAALHERGNRSHVRAGSHSEFLNSSAHTSSTWFGSPANFKIKLNSQKLKPRWFQSHKHLFYLRIGRVAPAVLRRSRALVHVSAPRRAPAETQSGIDNQPSRVITESK